MTDDRGKDKHGNQHENDASAEGDDHRLQRPLDGGVEAAGHNINERNQIMQRDIGSRHGGQRLQLQVAVAEGICDAVLENQHEQIYSNADATTEKQGIDQQRFDPSVVLGADAVRHQRIHGLRQPENRHVDDKIEVTDDGEGRNALGANLTHQHKVEDVGGDRRRNRSQHLGRAVEKHLFDFLASTHHLAEADKPK